MCNLSKQVRFILFDIQKLLLFHSIAEGKSADNMHVCGHDCGNYGGSTLQK